MQKYIAQAKEFLKAGVPLEGLGVQGHFNSALSGPEILAKLDEVATVGLPIWVTELDYVNADDQKRADFLEDALYAFFRSDVTCHSMIRLYEFIFV